jgi:hypothetical protein
MSRELHQSQQSTVVALRVDQRKVKVAAPGAGCFVRQKVNGQTSTLGVLPVDDEPSFASHCNWESLHCVSQANNLLAVSSKKTEQQILFASWSQLHDKFPTLHIFGGL